MAFPDDDKGDDWPFEDHHTEIDVPVVTPGVWVIIQIKDAGHWDATGRYVHQRAEPVRKMVHDRDSCRADPSIPGEEDLVGDPPHQSTICIECIDTWCTDYYVTLGESPFDMGLKDKI